jgi:hypothetical protein
MTAVSGRRWFVYFRVAREHEADAVAALRAVHVRWPALRCELLRRADERVEHVTLMEVYATHEAQAVAQQEASDAVAPWLIGERHLEVFEPCA